MPPVAAVSGGWLIRWVEAYGLMDYEIQRCTRHCALSDRELAPGEGYYSVLVPEGSAVCRLDYSEEAWDGPPQGALAWWKSRLPTATERRKRWAPNDAMLRFFEELGEVPGKEDVRYVLALLLVRRRVMRVEEGDPSPEESPMLVLFCPRNGTTYTIAAAAPAAERIEAIQEELARLLQ